MGEVLNQRDRLRLVSISRIAELLGMDRKTVSKRLLDANVPQAGKRDGYPVYDGRQACEACLLPQTLAGEDGPLDPRQMKPMDRRAWFQSERERISLEADARQLIPAGEVESEMAEVVRSFVQFLDTLPDSLERDVGLTAEQVDAVNKSIAKQRGALYAQLQAEDQDEAASA
ncbi:MAG: DUF1441 family protein [Lysobacterales bacterium]|jgi:hypothetical protein